MGKRGPQRQAGRQEPHGHGIARFALPALIFLCQVVFLPGAASPFRTPKMALMVGGLVIIVACSAVAAWHRGRLRVANGGLALVLISLPALQIASALWSAVPLKALQSGVVSLVWVAAILHLARSAAPYRTNALVAALAGAVVSAGVMFLDAAGIHLLPVSAEALKFRQRLVGLTGNPADLAITATLLLPLVLARGSERGPMRSFMWASSAVLVVATVVTQTLSAFAALAALGGVWIVFHPSRRIVVAAATATVVTVAGVLLWTTTDRVETGFRRLARGNWYSLLSARFDGWSAAAQMISEAPVLGVGAGHFSHSFYTSRVAWLQTHDQIGHRGELATHFGWAHCDPLQMAAEQGVVGALWMISFAWFAMRGRPRGDPLFPLAVAAALPLLLLHYPTHVAAGLLPITLILAELVARDPDELVLARRPTVVRRLGSTALIVTAASVCWWQLQVVTVDAWRGGMESILLSLVSAEPEQQARTAAFVEGQAGKMLRSRGHDDPKLWSLLGRARLARGNAAGAEQAFRQSYALWPHEEAEFGLGLALAAQGKRSQALVHLGRVCRVNRRLASLIEDEDLARAVRTMTRARFNRSRGGGSGE